MPGAHVDEESLPFAPGAGPFHIKGVVYRAHVEYVNAFVPGGEKAVNAAFRNAALRAFFEQQFLAASWYDLMPIVPVWYTCARLLRQSPNDFLKVRARHQALTDIHGVYRLILKIASAETVALRMPRVITQYFDFGTAQAAVARAGVVRVEYTGIPMFLVPWLSIVGETYLSVALEVAGAKQTQLRRHPTVPSGHAHGMPVATMGVDIHLDATRSDRVAGR
jgi:hypothetical protein